MTTENETPNAYETAVPTNTEAQPVDAAPSNDAAVPAVEGPSAGEGDAEGAGENPGDS